MNIGKKFNGMTADEYRYFIDNHKNYKDFNVLGLYRSLAENPLLSHDEKLEVRDYAHEYFRRQFDFLQVKDPFTYFAVETLGQELTAAAAARKWEEIRRNQERILADKGIRHRNFGVYAKHQCGYDWCPLNGLMVRQGSPAAEGRMRFPCDTDKTSVREKSLRRKKERKDARLLLRGQEEE